jgi:hypothetical protein
MPFLVKPALSAKMTRAVEKDLQHTIEETTGRILDMGENPADFELIPVRETHHTVVRAAYSAPCIRRNLARGFSSASLSMSSSTPTVPVFIRLPRSTARANSTGLPDATINGVIRAWVQSLR